MDQAHADFDAATAGPLATLQSAVAPANAALETALTDAKATLEGGVTAAENAANASLQPANVALYATYSDAYDTLGAAWTAAGSDQALKDPAIDAYNATMTVAVAQWQVAYDAIAAVVESQLVVLKANFDSTVRTAGNAWEAAINPPYATFVAATHPAWNAYVAAEQAAWDDYLAAGGGGSGDGMAMGIMVGDEQPGPGQPGPGGPRQKPKPSPLETLLGVEPGSIKLGGKIEVEANGDVKIEAVRAEYNFGDVRLFDTILLRDLTLFGGIDVNADPARFPGKQPFTSFDTVVGISIKLP